MSTTDFRQSRRDADREQDREDRRQAQEAQLQREQLVLNANLEQQRLQAEADAADREQDRADKAAAAERERLAQELKDRQRAERIERERQVAAAAAKEKARLKAKTRAERRERRNAALKAAPGFVSQHLDLVAALVVMACSIIPALISQGSSLKLMGLDPWMVALLPVMLEASAWAATAAEAKAAEAGRATWPYRVAVWLFASLAGSVNYGHGLQIGGKEYGFQVGVVLAASSIVPIALWQLIQMGRHRAAKAKAKAARKARRDAFFDRRARSRQYPQVWQTAKQLRAIAGRSELSMPDAWTAAWAVHEGAGEQALTGDLLTLLSADLLGLRVEAEDRLATILGHLHTARTRRMEASGKPSAESAQDAGGAAWKVSAAGVVTLPTGTDAASATAALEASGGGGLLTVSPQITPSVPPLARTREKAPARPRATRKGPAVRTLSPGARKAAAETAKAFDANENSAIEAWIADELRAGREPSAKDVATEVVERRRTVTKKPKVPGRTWCYDRITAAKKHGGLHVVRTERSA
ncbi:DUF2637 domain-containing protein [Streptomyces sp. H10-C2]|uniref:DUF2637 domain-containing protein n=1 Tax=unclassified Streptomyces TaxID=2593676 RepID=UPI0024B9FA51|nr:MULTISPECIES: DUF2637 domain-containing protein [unclassified Streptomyces]MDJ0346364.1 DUF2637 domain-containing protein [Streptomyces sp. PH10-H1]MDJ0374946.1 DUF2637 domain-containing protein [Streptomyces sp. H10-C2]